MLRLIRGKIRTCRGSLRDTRGNDGKTDDTNAGGGNNTAGWPWICKVSADTGCGRAERKFPAAPGACHDDSRSALELAINLEHYRYGGGDTGRNSKRRPSWHSGADQFRVRQGGSYRGGARRACHSAGAG